MLFSRRPLAAAFHLAPLSPPLLLFFASASSSCSPAASAAAASVSGSRGCTAARMDSGAVETASTGAVWSSPSAEPRSISVGKEVFCNRSLNMRNITAVGFDMDYTLAQYKPETFESLAYYGTIEKLVKDLRYPEELLTWEFDWKYMVRGLVLDKKRGNILKMDRHKYVKVAYHGFKELSKEEKVAAYGSTLIRDSFDEPDYALIDTLFSLGEAYLFAQLVDFIDKNPGKVPAGTDYPLMYRDVRSAVDLCHRDGTLKRMVAKDPARYINEDLAIVPMLEMIRKSGRSTFLVTNSLWDYTDVVMNYLCGPYTSGVGSGLNHKWLQYFDIVITGSSKPSFFHDDNRAGLFEVEPDSGKLLNADIQASKFINSNLSSCHMFFPKIYAILREDRKPKIKSSTLNTSSESLSGGQCWSSPQITFCCF
ncbi:Cytosolic purine 5-nucleotidase [Zea mays]|uniref:Cytosolic purine 5-nucleotidase n=1 Tax=Zea mays TaxID=4577 RepID=A0A1D6L6B7_MAIZE|nr:Cytosolic purine 5-nucleotidase [Zea mays]